MKRVIYITAILILIAGIAAISSIIISEENKKIEPLEISLSSSTMLSAECDDKNYIINKADYIIDVNVSDITNEEFHGSGDFAGNSWNVSKNEMIIARQNKGDLRVAKLSIITNPGLEDQPEFSMGNFYRLYLYDNREVNKIMLVCESAGVEEIGLI